LKEVDDDSICWIKINNFDNWKFISKNLIIIKKYNDMSLDKSLNFNLTPFSFKTGHEIQMLPYFFIKANSY